MSISKKKENHHQQKFQKQDDNNNQIKSDNNEMLLLLLRYSLLYGSNGRSLRNTKSNRDRMYKYDLSPHTFRGFTSLHHVHTYFLPSSFTSFFTSSLRIFLTYSLHYALFTPFLSIKLTTTSNETNIIIIHHPRFSYADASNGGSSLSLPSALSP